VGLPAVTVRVWLAVWPPLSVSRSDTDILISRPLVGREVCRESRHAVSAAKRMRRKLKKFKSLIDAGKMKFEDLRCAYQSWRGNFRKRFNACYCISRMDALYNKLFIQCRDAAVEGKNGLYRKEKRQGILQQKP
jgi:hypothetical protein